MTRNEIRSMIKFKNDEIKSLNDKIKSLNDEITLLKIKEYKICDENQWYSESMQTIFISRRPKRTREVLVGRIHWIESFKDESTDEIRKIERSRVVYQDGVWYVYN